MNALRRLINADARIGAALGLLLISTALPSCRRAGPDPLAHGWKRIRVEPLAGSIILQQGEESGCIWRVNQEAKKVTVSRATSASYKHSLEVRIQTVDGTLVGEDRGEWGGSLTLLDAKGEPPREILDKNVLQMLQVPSGILVITGNLPENEGSVWLYSNRNGQGWTIEQKAELTRYPRVIGRSKEGILLVNGDSVDLVDDVFRVRRVAVLPLLQVQPNSVVEDGSGAIYIGMQAFVIRLVPSHLGYTHEWFAGSGCLP